MVCIEITEQCGGTFSGEMLCKDYGPGIVIVFVVNHIYSSLSGYTPACGIICKYSCMIDNTSSLEPA